MAVCRGNGAVDSSDVWDLVFVGEQGEEPAGEAALWQPYF